VNVQDRKLRRRWRRLLRRVEFWEAEYSLTALLVMLVLTLFVVTPLASGVTYGSEILMCFLAVLTITGVAAVSGRPIVIIAVVLLAVFGIGIDWAAHFNHSETLRILDNVLRLLFVLLLAVVVTIQVFRPGNVTHHRVQGAICVYLLAGLAWAYSFDLLALLDANAFRLAENFNSVPARVSVFRYFSFVTLTTLGYGDIVPVSPIARSLATSEALFGQLFPAVMIARLISLEILDRRRGERDLRTDEKNDR
jgi:voltage-gated potassium channel Kch